MDKNKGVTVPWSCLEKQKVGGGGGGVYWCESDPVTRFSDLESFAKLFAVSHFTPPVGLLHSSWLACTFLQVLMLCATNSTGNPCQIPCMCKCARP